MLDLLQHCVSLLSSCVWIVEGRENVEGSHNWDSNEFCARTDLTGFD